MKLSNTIPVTPSRASTHWSPRSLNGLSLVIGLTAFGLGEGLLVQSHWGATPWTVITAGWLLGGTVGAAAAFFAATIGFSIGASLHATEWIVRRARP